MNSTGFDYKEMIPALSELGAYFLKVSDFYYTGNIADNDEIIAELHDAITRAGYSNPYFIPEFITYNLNHWGILLSGENIEVWLQPYLNDLKRNRTPKRVVVIMAGNIPMVGFHDFLCTLLSGNIFLGKLSSNDSILIPAIAKVLMRIEPRFNNLIAFTDGKASGFDAVIATGSNNTGRYFEYYFGRYPNIIRRNRNGVAVLTGNETESQLTALADDLFLYFGLGCRNVSKLFLPINYAPNDLLKYFARYEHLMKGSHKYMNNYIYQRSICVMNNVSFIDNSFVLLTENQAISSPIGMIYYEYYQSKEELLQRLEVDKENIQCVVAAEGNQQLFTGFGHSQKPLLWQYSDGIDTMKFLLEIDNE